MIKKLMLLGALSTTTGALWGAASSGSWWSRLLNPSGYDAIADTSHSTGSPAQFDLVENPKIVSDKVGNWILSSLDPAHLNAVFNRDQGFKAALLSAFEKSSKNRIGSIPFAPKPAGYPTVKPYRDEFGCTIHPSSGDSREVECDIIINGIVSKLHRFNFEGSGKYAVSATKDGAGATHFNFTRTSEAEVEVNSHTRDFQAERDAVKNYQY